jgi:serine/threonine protein kinase
VKEFFPPPASASGEASPRAAACPPQISIRCAPRFLEEARILARFELPAVVRVMGAWEENASAYMEMELLRGPTLAKYLRSAESYPLRKR